MKGKDAVGFASFGDFRPFPGYRHTVENSVYVDERHHRLGVGRSLLAALIERATALDKHVMIAGIEAANAASINLHASLGFVEVGRMPEVGCKFGRWLDLVFMQKRLASGVRP
jgi:phosphinothricin acetyltransferase